jgi:CBS domain containing-hemolysin-like protein
MDLLLGFTAIALLIAANGWFVLGEFAFVAARRPQLEVMAERGERGASSALAVLGRLSFMLSGAQLGITVTSLLVGFIAEPVFSAAVAPLLGPLGLPAEQRSAIAIGVGLVVATSAQMVFGELAPKNLGIALPEAASRRLARGIRVYLAVAGPVIRLFDGASNALLRAVGIEPVEELSGGVSAEELDFIIAESGRGGVLSTAQADLLGRVLDFRTLRAAEAMVARPQVVAIATTASCTALQQLAVATGHSRFPVTAGEDLDEVLGVVTAKDVLGVPHDERAQRHVGELVVEPLVVPESAQLGPLLGELRRAHATLAVVIDEHGGTAGVITLEDIVEELVGSIRDEHDPEEPLVQALPSGAFLAPASWRPDEVTRDTGLHLPEGDYETVSGLVMDRLGRMPNVGDVVELTGVRVHVEAMEGHAVSRVRLVPVDSAGEHP